MPFLIENIYNLSCQIRRTTEKVENRMSGAYNINEVPSADIV